MLSLRAVVRRIRATLPPALLAGSLLVLGAGCIPKVAHIGLRDAHVPMPDTFGADAAAEQPLEAARPPAIYEDPNLVALIDEALANNQELAILRQEVFAAEARIGGRLGEAFPKLGVGVDVGLEKVGRFTSQGAADASSEMLPGKEVPERLPNFGVVLQASWEVDIWQKLTNATRAARTRAMASVEARNLATTLLVAEVANSYYELLALDRQLEVVEANIAILEEALRIVELQRQAARVTVLAVQRFEAELLKNRSHRFALLQEIVETENRINGMLGRYPQSIARSTETFLDTPLDPVDPGAPGQLLERRPDVRAAELGLDAARLDVKVARASFFPALAIDAEFGIEAFTPAKLVDLPASMLYGIAGNLLAPLLNRSELRAEYTIANAEQMAAVLSFEQTALQAYLEVATGIARIDNVDAEYDLKAQQVDRMEQAIETSNRLFQSARADYLEVLLTRREALEARMELIETRRDQVSARIDLYRAVGGGWTPSTVAATDSLTPENPAEASPPQGDR